MFNFRRRSAGQGMVEYILIVVVVVGIVLAGYKIFGEKLGAAFKSGGNRIETEAKVF